MLLIIIVAIYYTVAFDMHRLLLFIVYSISVFIGGVILVIATRPLPLFISYEMLLLPTAYIIDTCSKTARSRDAAKSMCIWTQSGAFILFSAVGILIGDHTQFLVGGHSQAGLSAAGATLLVIATTFGFGTKMPIYPFYW